jgi:hypothetical protein
MGTYPFRRQAQFKDKSAHRYYQLQNRCRFILRYNRKENIR